MKMLIKGRKLHYKTEVQGLPVSIENRKGSIRRGSDGKGEWETKMTHPYGYIRGTIGTDGDHVDCFVGPDKESNWVYIIHIKNPKTGKFDEDKTFLGFNSLNHAMAAFRKNYDDWARYYMGFDVMEMNEFREAIQDKGKKIESDKHGKGSLFTEKELKKSTVKAHTRKTSTGKVVNVNRYENKKKKNETDDKHGLRTIGNKIKTFSSKVGNFGRSRIAQVFKVSDYSGTKYIVVLREGVTRYLGNAQWAYMGGKKNVHFKEFKTIANTTKFIDNYIKSFKSPMKKSIKISTDKRLNKSTIAKVFGHSQGFGGVRLICKSWSSSLQAKYPGSRWVRITDKSSPLHGRAILIVPHKDGRATIAWAPHHSGLSHKVLSPRKSKKEDKPQKPQEKPEKKQELSDEERKAAQEKKKKLTINQKKIKEKMHEKIQSKLGIETKVTREEKAKIDKEVSKIADKKERNIERLKEFNKIKSERDKAIDEVISEAKKAMLGERDDLADMTNEQKNVREVIKENAEEFLQYHYQIKAYQREKNAVSKLLRDGGKYKGGNDIIEVTPLSKDELKQVLSDEKAVGQEIADHYSLIVNTRGGIDKDGNEVTGKGTGSKIIEKNIVKGGFEAMTGLTGEATGNSILDLDRYRAMGSNNAAILMNYYFENTLGKEAYHKKMEELQNYISGDGQKVAADAMSRGDKYLERAQKIKDFARGEDALFGDRVQANGMSLQYIQRAYESYGQAEGSLNQAAETLYQFQNKKKSMEFTSGSRQKLNSIRDKLKLNKSDAHIVMLDDRSYRMTIPPSSFEKLIKEKPVSEKRKAGEATASDIKAGKLNTDNYLPEGLNAYLPPDKKGVSQKLVLEPHQQSAARLTAKENKVYLNFEAGTGKSLTYLAAIAEIKSETGKMPKTIISMPKKLMPNFQEEVKKFTDFNVVIVDSSSKAKRERLYNGDPNTIVLVNKEKYFFDKDMIKGAGFDMMIVDEAHKSTQREKGKSSGMSKGLAEIASNTKYFIAGTGSPTPNDLSELYFYLKTIDPEKYSSQKQFMEKYQNLHRGAGLKEKLKEILHREIDDKVFTVKKDLKHTFRQHIHNASLSKDQKHKYKKIMTDFRSKKIDALTRDQRINKLLNATGHEENQKFDKMGSIINEHMKTRGKDEKVIIYAQQYKTVDEIEKYIKKNYPGQGVVRFDGKTKLNDIDKNKQAFRQNEKVKFAIHTDAGTEGLNLQYTGKPGEYGATTAIAMASGAYSYSTLDQFFSRANRKGVPKEMNIDGHLVLTDTPHDIKTEMRLEDKKAVMSLVDNAKRIDDQGVLGGAMRKSLGKKLILKWRS